MTDTASTEIPPVLRPFLYDSAEIPFSKTRDYTDTLEDRAMAEATLRAFGEDFASKTLVDTPSLLMVLCSVPPGTAVPPHRHGTHQMTYVLKGELRYGARVAGPGMGYFNPNRFYTWTAGPDGAEFLEIHDNNKLDVVFPEIGKRA